MENTHNKKVEKVTQQFEALTKKNEALTQENGELKTQINALTQETRNNLRLAQILECFKTEYHKMVTQKHRKWFWHKESMRLTEAITPDNDTTALYKQLQQLSLKGRGWCALFHCRPCSDTQHALKKVLEQNSEYSDMITNNGQRQPHTRTRIRD